MSNRIVEIQNRLDRKYKSGVQAVAAGFSRAGGGVWPRAGLATSMSPMEGLYNDLVGEVRKELNRPFTDPNDPQLLERRRRLRWLFRLVPADYAWTLYSRLGTQATQDELSQAFHGKLATATRMELLEILVPKFSKQAEAPARAAPPPPPVWPTQQLPASEAGRFSKALSKLEALVKASNDARKWRYDCWIEMLKRGDTDDRVIEWGRICPSTTGATGGLIVIGPCDVRIGRRPTQANIEQRIRSVADVDQFGHSLGIITYLKADIVVSEEMTAMPLENLRSLHDDVQRTVEKLGEWANLQMGGSSAMPPAYRAIKDWLARRQSDPKSLYHCR